jgi:hypothetical protein
LGRGAIQPATELPFSIHSDGLLRSMERQAIQPSEPTAAARYGVRRRIVD